MVAFPAEPYTQLLGSNGPVNALTYSSPASSSTYILTGSSDRSVRLYNPANQASSVSGPPVIATYAGHAYPILSLSISPSNSTFVSTSTSDRSIFLWDVSTATVIRRFASAASASTGSAARINCVTFAGSNGDDVLVSGGFDCAVRIWDVRAQNSRKEIMILTEARDSVEAVIAGSGTSSGNDAWETMSGSSDGRVRCYDIRMGALTEDVIGAPVTSLTRTRDGKGVLVGSLDSKIRLLDTTQGQCLQTYKDDSLTHSRPYYKNTEFRLKNCFGANERFVLSGNENVAGKSGDGEVLVWDTLSGEIVHRVTVVGAVGAKKRVGPDGKEKERTNVVSCVAWKGKGKGDQWCCGGTDGAVTVFGGG